MLNSEQNVQVCDASTSLSTGYTGDASSTTAGYIILLKFLIQIKLVLHFK